MITQEKIAYSADDIKAMLKTCEKYKQALERASKLRVQNPFDTVGQMVEHIFPELKESEDDKIREKIMNLVKKSNEQGGYALQKWEADDMLAWLEKQGEQTSTNKVEPKFKVGDWIVSNNDGTVWQIGSMYYVNGPGIYLYNSNGVKISITEDELIINYHLWTIQDAKDGDVLAVDPIDSYSFPVVAIYKERGLDFFNSYCFIGFDGKFYESESGHSIEEIHPATKEQRDLLFSKMKQEGYEWDAEKKELKKVEPKTLDADKVIEWIDEHVPTKFEDMANYVQQFKQDFGL